MPSACATNKNSCGLSGSFATSGNFSGSGTKDPGCGDAECRDFSATYNAEHFMSVCQTGRYVVSPTTAFFGQITNAGGAMTVPHVQVQENSGLVCVDLGKVTKDAVTKRTDYIAATNPAFPEEWPALTTPVPGDLFVPRVRVSNRSACVAYVTTGDCTVPVEGVHHQVGVQPGELVELSYSPARNLWHLTAHSLA